MAQLPDRLDQRVGGGPDAEAQFLAQLARGARMVIAAGPKLVAQGLPDSVDGQPAKQQDEKGEIGGTNHK